MSNARLSFAALFLAGALVAGCSSDDSNGSTPNGQGESDASVGNGSEGGGGEGGTLGDGGPGAGDGGPSGDAGPSPTGLDETGATIPDTNYPAPAGAIYMAPNGVDTAAGSEAAPVLTLAKAIALVPSGGTIVVRGGTYRDGAVQTSKPFTLQAYPHEKPWFDGTDLPAASAWTNDGAGHWTMPWNTPTFCGGHYYDSPYDAQTTANTGPCSHYDMVNAAYVDTQYAAVGDPQMVFVDGVYVHEVTTLAAATGANFYYDQTAKKMYVASDPALHEVEVAARPSALIFSGAGTKILGIGFKRYATNEYSNADVGAVYGGGTGALFENDVFTEMAGGALATSPSSTVSLSVFAKNGFNGMGSNGHQHSTKEADGLVIQGSIFNANNQEHFGDHCSASCAQAGVK
ncbi:MAG TPA: hypothetical protein VF407_19550, partial [Polyangiaceae bacterium]